MTSDDLANRFIALAENYGVRGAVSKLDFAADALKLVRQYMQERDASVIEKLRERESVA